MWEAISQLFISGDIWAIIIKVLITTLLGAATAWIGTLIANAIVKNKNSKIYKYAETLVEAAEQKFPNEGTKMGPQKLDYVMSQIIIKFPRIKDNQYLYNIVEQAVYKLNEKRNQDVEAQIFFDKYGEWPEGYTPPEIENNDEVDEEESSTLENDKNEVVENTLTNESQQQLSYKVKKKKLSSF